MIYRNVNNDSIKLEENDKITGVVYEDNKLWHIKGIVFLSLGLIIDIKNPIDETVCTPISMLAGYGIKETATSKEIDKALDYGVKVLTDEDSDIDLSLKDIEIAEQYITEAKEDCIMPLAKKKFKTKEELIKKLEEC